MNFALGTKKDYLRVHLVCKRMKVYTPLRSLQGDFSDDQIHAIMEREKVEGPKRNSIRIVGPELEEYELEPYDHTRQISNYQHKITLNGLCELMSGKVQWRAMSFRRIDMFWVLDYHHQNVYGKNKDQDSDDSDDGMECWEHIETMWANLRVLEMIRVNRMGFQILEYMESLEVLRVSGEDSYEVLEHARHCSSLREIELCQCPFITNEELRDFCRGFRGDKISIYRCKNITMDCVQDLQSKYNPGINIYMNEDKYAEWDMEEWDTYHR